MARTFDSKPVMKVLRYERSSITATRFCVSFKVRFATSFTRIETPRPRPAARPSGVVQREDCALDDGGEVEGSVTFDIVTVTATATWVLCQTSCKRQTLDPKKMSVIAFAPVTCEIGRRIKSLKKAEYYMYQWACTIGCIGISTLSNPIFKQVRPTTDLTDL